MKTFISPEIYNRFLFTGLLFAFMLPAPVAKAAIRPLSKTELEEKAKDVFVGRVLSVTSSEGKSPRFDDGTDFTDRTFTITLHVISVLKSKSVKAESTVTVEAWQPVGGKQTGLIGLIGPQGHQPIPNKGNVVTVYSNERKSVAQTGSNQKQMVFIPLLPNGMLIDQGKTTNANTQPGTKQNALDTTDAGDTKTLQALSNSTAFQFMATLALFKEMLIHSWDEKTYRQFAFYHGLNQTTLADLAKKYETDTTWGVWFKDRVAYQASIFKALQPYIEKKRKGEMLTAQQIADINQMQREVTAKLGR